MKRISIFCAVMAFVSVAYAGPETFPDKELTSAPAPRPSWYADNEWNVSLWRADAFHGTENDRSTLADTFFKEPGPGTYDRFLGDDHAFGGGADVKYFFHRYFGVGIEGFGLASNGTSYTVEDFGAAAAFREREKHAFGGVLGTLTLRYPIGSTRFSPYVWAGGGGIFGGHNETAVYVGGNLERINHEVESRGMGQFGGGLEFRVTPHIGLISDFSWNVLEGPNNNFGMVRTGINFAL